MSADEMDQYFNVLKDFTQAGAWDGSSGNPAIALYVIESEMARIVEALKQAQAENERLREALEQISNGEGRYGAQAFEYKQIARQALTKEPSSDQ